MPSLIRLSEFKGNHPDRFPPYYFTSVTHKDSNWVVYSLETDYPNIAYIHRDRLEDISGFWVELRRWVERNCSGDVLTDYKNMSYEWWWNRDAKDYQKKTTTIKHAYWLFYFENFTDLQMFKLIHSEKISDNMEKYHPEYGQDVLDQDRIFNRVQNNG